MCNPPYYESQEQMESLKQRKVLPPVAKCTGNDLEMITEGGEIEFIRLMIEESLKRRDDIVWFTSLVGRKESLRSVRRILESVDGIQDIKWTTFIQGYTSRWAVAWTFFELPADSELKDKLKIKSIQE